MLSLPQIAAFVAVIEEGTFLSAAKRLGLSQATVSQHVLNLEALLGVNLVIRSRIECRPTQRGAVLLRFARPLLLLAERAEHSVRDTVTIVGASGNIGTYLLPPYVRRFLDGEPSSLLSLAIAPNPELADALERRTMDLAVMEWWDGRPGFDVRPWRSESMVVIVAPDHPWADRISIEPEELFEQALIGGEAGTGTGTLLQRLFGTAAANLKVNLTLGSTEAVKAAVKARLGISLVMAAAVEAECRNGSLRALSVSDAHIAKELVVVLPNDIPRSATAFRFAALLAS